MISTRLSSRLADSLFPAISAPLRAGRAALLLVLLLGAAQVRASVSGEHALQFHLSFGDRLPLEAQINPADSWTISKGGSVVQSGNGPSLLAYVFADPGEYEVVITEATAPVPGGCDHGALPDEIEVIVSATRMEFDFAHAIFSTPISSGVVSGVTLSIPVIVDTYDGTSFEFHQDEVQSAGVGSNLTAVPLEASITLSPGTHTLRYQLTGGVERPTYVMFDFIDANGRVQPFALTQQLH